jgi:two-component system, LuxR family, response regulator FixJ
VSTRHVYVVDDEEPIRRSSQLMLRVMGYSARTFETGSALLEQLPTLEPGCVLLDMRMPGIDGLEVQRRLNHIGASHSVVVMSGHGDLSVAVPAMERGAVAFLEKPFPRDALRTALDIGFLKLADPSGYQRYVEQAAARVAQLGEFERRVLILLTRGMAQESIAAELGLPPAQIDLCQTRVFADLQIDSVNEALRVAFAADLPRGNPH